jgi:hypothetical protein
LASADPRAGNRFNTLSLWIADLIVESYGRPNQTATVEKVVEVLKVSRLPGSFPLAHWALTTAFV